MSAGKEGADRRKVPKAPWPQKLGDASKLSPALGAKEQEKSGEEGSNPQRRTKEAQPCSGQVPKAQHVFRYIPQGRRPTMAPCPGLNPWQQGWKGF